MVARHRFRVELAVIAVIVAILAHPGLAQSRAALPNGRPNILFVFTDDHAPHAIGAYGGLLAQLTPTPTIDRLAAAGMLFRNSFCTNSICGPSRAVILTGKFSHLNGFMHNGNRFDATQQTFPKLLRAAGYQTAIIGKWHLKSKPTGFDHWCVLPGQGLYYNPDFLTPKGKERREGYCTDLVTDMAIEWLDQRDPSKPFLLMCQHKAPHRTWMPPLRYLHLYDDVEIPEPPTLFDDHADDASPARYQQMEIDRHMSLIYDLKLEAGPDFDLKKERGDASGYRNLARMTAEQRRQWDAAYGPKNAAFRAAKLSGKALVRWKYQRYIKDYLRCIKGVDDSVARLLAALDAKGLAANTIVIYSSDQGFFLGDHGWFDKRWMYEESLRMPFIAKWPGVTKAGSECQAMIQNLDYAPTLLEAAGVDVPSDMQGRSLVPFLRGKAVADWRTSIYYHYFEYPGVHMTARHYGVRTQRYKLIRFYQFDEWEFFDLERDPDECQNEYSNPEYADVIAKSKVELERLRKLYRDDTDVNPMPAEWRARFRSHRESLIDPHGLKGWTTFDGKAVGPNWEVVDGVLHHKGHGGSIMSEASFGDFDLSFEWRIAAGGNSGLKYRFDRFDGQWLGCEYQLLDAKDGEGPKRHRTAALYDVYEPDGAEPKPAGEFNRSRILVRGDRIEHWLNGRCVVVANTASEEWRTRIAQSKFRNVDGFGRRPRGRIMLQDHGAEVWFRNLVITTADTGPASRRH